MIRVILSGAGYLLLLGGLFAAYSGAARLYEPLMAPQLDVGIRAAKLGSLVYDCKRINLGMELCRQSVVTSPDSAQAHFQLAVMCIQQGLPLEAVGQYRETLRCHQDRAEPRIELGVVLLQMGRLEAAAEEFRRAGDHPEAQRQLEITERALRQQRRSRP